MTEEQTVRRFRLAALSLFLSLCLCGCAASFPRAVRMASLSFDPETEGLVLVRTVDESDGSVRYSALAPGSRCMDTDAFTPDAMQVTTVRGFTVFDNQPGPLRAYDEAGAETPFTREISAICRAMREVDHHVLQCRIMKVGDEWFASAMLNVNLWTPYRFYWFDRDTGRLTLLYTFDGRDVAAIRVLSADRLRALDQDSIGGWEDDDAAPPRTNTPGVGYCSRGEQ